MTRFKIVSDKGDNVFDILIYAKQKEPVELRIKGVPIELKKDQMYEAKMKIGVFFNGVVNSDNAVMYLTTEQVVQQDIHDRFRPFVSIDGIVHAVLDKGNGGVAKYCRIKLDSNCREGDELATFYVQLAKENESNLVFNVGDVITNADVKLEVLSPKKFFGILLRVNN